MMSLRLVFMALLSSLIFCQCQSPEKKAQALNRFYEKARTSQIAFPQSTLDVAHQQQKSKRYYSTVYFSTLYAWLKTKPHLVYDLCDPKVHEKLSPVSHARIIHLDEINESVLGPDKNRLRIFYGLNDKDVTPNLALERARQLGYRSLVLYVDGLEDWDRQFPRR